MWGLSIQHWIIVAGVLALVFGAKKVPAMMADLGKSVKELRKLPDAVLEDERESKS
jgi:TatA/E family protein of Tat protein translocase